MNAQTVTEGFAQSDELIHSIAARLQSRFGGQLRDLRIMIHRNHRNCPRMKGA